MGGPSLLVVIFDSPAAWVSRFAIRPLEAAFASLLSVVGVPARRHSSVAQPFLLIGGSAVHIYLLSLSPFTTHVRL